MAVEDGSNISIDCRTHHTSVEAVPFSALNPRLAAVVETIQGHDFDKRDVTEH
eukprot:CAMPEP_0185915444 /NCGR_PEP_ID=MMETSP0924C-20121207/2410_1 /TAXON_ID=321610 /ORGANISM="Perkinsus chesapeaki, Strain ATCC PRA-65" /LENGTH=52 /DNA_ID=CAMNT_0028639439 /DNA_START=265 /DNA_END=423 /DNA_ORIENTATION=+